LIRSEFVAACQIMLGDVLWENAANGLSPIATRHHAAELFSGPSLLPLVTILTCVIRAERANGKYPAERESEVRNGRGLSPREITKN
jgi:hypothetical protein